MKKVLKVICIILLLAILAIGGFMVYTSLHGNYVYKDIVYNVTEETGLSLPDPTLATNQMKKTLADYSIRFDGDTMIVEKTTQSGKKEQEKYKVSFDGENVILPEDFFICSVGNKYFDSVDTRTTTCTKSGKTIRFFIEEHYRTFTVTSTLTFESVL